MTAFDRFPRKSLCFLPTPIAQMPRLAARLGGPRLFVKRDDLTGLALGGNKTRKLEFLVGEALATGCDTLVTGGAEQSNHCRQTAAAAAAAGLACHLVLGGEEPAVPSGNYLLDRLLGARVHWTGEQRKGERIPEIAETLRSAGRVPYVIPYGGSNATGALGLAAAATEVTAQFRAAGVRPTQIVFASSSAGTHAGLLAGAALCGLGARLVGIGIDKGEAGEEPLPERIAALARETGARLGLDREFSRGDVVLREEYLGAGYGVVGDLERRAIRWTAECEGILLDPVYTGRAMGGLLDLVERGEFTKEDTVLFWHTGGTPALFAHGADLFPQATPTR